MSLIDPSWPCEHPYKVNRVLPHYCTYIRQRSAATLHSISMTRQNITLPAEGINVTFAACKSSSTVEHTLQLRHTQHAAQHSCSTENP